MTFEALARLQVQLRILGRVTAPQKVAAFLLEMAERLLDGHHEYFFRFRVAALADSDRLIARAGRMRPTKRAVAAPAGSDPANNLTIAEAAASRVP
jgi:hypothetical protein